MKQEIFGEFCADCTPVQRRIYEDLISKEERISNWELTSKS